MPSTVEGDQGLSVGHRAKLLALSLPSSIAFEDDRPTVQGHARNPSRLAVGLSAAEGACDSVQRVPSKEGSVDGTHSLSLVRDELASGGIAHRTNPFWGALPCRARWTCARDWRAPLRSTSARATAALMRAYMRPPSVPRSASPFAVTRSRPRDSARSIQSSSSRGCRASRSRS